MEEFGRLEERVILIGVQTAADENVEVSLDELEELASTAGAVTVGKVCLLYTSDAADEFRTV